MVVLEGACQLAGAKGDLLAARRPQLDQSRVDAGDLADGPPAVRAWDVDEPQSEDSIEMGLESGVVGLRGGGDRLVHRPAVDRPPLPVDDGLHLVRHRDVGVEVRVAGPVVAMGERRGDQSAHVDLLDPGVALAGLEHLAPR